MQYPPPERIPAPRLSDYLAVMTKAIFQAGLRWSLIDAKWPAFLECFEHFDPVKVAAFSTKDIQRLSQDERILRSEKKITATVENAKVLLELDKQYNGFRNYLQSFNSYEEAAADLKKQFAFMGELNAYYFLFRVSEPVPDFDDWVKTIPGDHPRMKEMVEHARQQDQVTRS